MNTDSTSFKINVYPDGVNLGYSLNQLLLFLQWENGDFDFGNWPEFFNNEIEKEGGYILNPIKITLEPGEYKLSSFVRIFTLADFSIEGAGVETSILFSKFDVVNNQPNYLDKQEYGRDRIMVIASPWKDDDIFKKHPDYNRANRSNTLILRNLKIRLEEGKWYPAKELDALGLPIGVLISYNNFHRAIISNVDIKLNNGEITILDGDECDHQEISDCYLYLNNWNDRTQSSEFERRREQGCNLNIRGNNESVLIERNTFVKHGNDEALAFLRNGIGEDRLPPDISHENIKVTHNSFTYLDADPINIFPDNTDNHDLATPDNNRPVHVNDVLVSFIMAGNDSDSHWKNVMFADNTFDLQGPVVDAVVMNVAQQDSYQDVVFANNTIRHSYHHNGKLPGNSAWDENRNNNNVENGANEYIYSSSFLFRVFNQPKDLAPDLPPDNQKEADGVNDNLVSYYGNTIIYSQHTYDSFYKWFAYEHSCFKIFGGKVDIHDNIIDGTGAAVERSAANGIFGNTDNPVSLIHCMPCKADERNYVKAYNNNAKGYGVVLRCRPQDEFEDENFVKDYTIQVETNLFAEGGVIVIDCVKDSEIMFENNLYTIYDKEFYSHCKKCENINLSMSGNSFKSA